MGTNFFGVVRMVRHCVPAMTGTCKRIVTVGSIGGRIGLPYNSMYSASKSATMLYTDSLRMELAQDGVAVSLVEPGDLKPGMLNAAKADGFDSNAYATGAFDIMRKEEAEGTDPRVVVKTVVGCVRSSRPKGRYLVGPDAWLVEVLTRLCSYPLREYFLASHYRIPPRHNAWIRV
jgi:NAD(P)-dependent dehydrogenase (short-subunit alcohol dehydrogenase family)